MPNPDTIIRNLGKKFRIRRKKLKKSQREIADISGVSLPTIGAFENGKSTGISLNILIQLLNAIGEIDLIEDLLSDRKKTKAKSNSFSDGNTSIQENGEKESNCKIILINLSDFIENGKDRITRTKKKN